MFFRRYIFLGLALLLCALPAQAQETAPGDACIAGEQGFFRRAAAGNAPVDGLNFLYCDGANWLGFLKYDESSSVVFLPAPATEPADGEIANSNWSLWLDEASSQFKLKGKKADGTVVAASAGGLWAAGTGDNIYYSSGSPRVGIGINPPLLALDVNGSIRFSSGGEVCDSTIAGALRYDSGSALELCNGTAWTLMLAQSASAVLSISPTADLSMDITVAGTPGVSSWQTFTVENLGTITSQIMAVTLSNPGNFELNGGTDTCTGNTLAPAATCVIEVRAKSFGNGSYGGTVTIAADNNPSAVLAGTATGACGTIGSTTNGGQLAACNATYKLIVQPSGCADDTSNPACGGADSITKQWSSSSIAYGAYSTTDGPANTSTVVAAAAPGDAPAAQFCANLDLNGFTDWYLPADGELADEIYPVKDTLGGFAASTYWSSRERDNNEKYQVSFSGGTSSYAGNTNIKNIRCARRAYDVSGTGNLGISPGARTDVDYVNRVGDLNNYTDATFTITNNGGAASAVMSTSLSNAADFNITSDSCDGNSIAAAATCTVTVRLNPSTDGVTYTGTLDITGNNGVSANLSGIAYGTCGVIGSVDSGGILAACQPSYRLIVQPVGCADDTTDPDCSAPADLVLRLYQTANGVTGANSGNNGPANTATLVGSGYTVPAAQFCDDLSQGGETDWYLPASNELVSHVYPNNSVLNFNASLYHSSAERTSSSSINYQISFADGSSNQGNKTQSRSIRCARQETGAAPTTVSFDISPSSQTGMDVTGPGDPATGTPVVFTVENTGTGTSGALATSVINSVNFEITADTCNTNTLTAGATCTVTVRPRAYADSNFNGSLSIVDAGNSITQLAGLSGTASGFSAAIAQWLNGVSAGDIYYNSGTPEVGIGTATPNVTLDVVGDIEFTGTITDVSDRRLKTDIQNLSEGQLKNLLALNGVSFKMNNDPEGALEYGFIAQDVEKIYPSLVFKRSEGMLSMNYMGLIAPMVEAIKEQNAQIKSLEARIEALEAK